MSELNERLALVEKAIKDTAVRVERNKSELEKVIRKVISLDANWQSIQEKLHAIDDLTQKIDDKIKADESGQAAIISAVKMMGAVLAAFFAALMYVVENYDKIMVFFSS